MATCRRRSSAHASTCRPGILRSHLEARAAYVVHVDAAVSSAVFEVLAQRELDAVEREVAPGDFVLAHQGCLERFVARTEITDQLARIEEVHLAGIDDVDAGEDVAQLDRRQRLFERLSRSPGCDRFAKLHETGG